MNSQEFTCRCGKYKGWITEGKLTVACPNCASIYRGKYNPKTLQIDAIYAGPDQHKHLHGFPYNFYEGGAGNPIGR